MIANTPRRILRLETVKSLTGLGRTKIYDLMQQGRFPQGRRIAGSRVTGWDSVEIDAWIAEQFGKVA
jgi:prophage regulatory protein